MKNNSFYERLVLLCPKLKNLGRRYKNKALLRHLFPLPGYPWDWGGQSTFLQGGSGESIIAAFDKRARGSGLTVAGAGGLTEIGGALVGGVKLELLLREAVMVLLLLPPFSKTLF